MEPGAERAVRAAARADAGRSGPRVPPGTKREIGKVNYWIARLVGAATGGPPPNLFLTLARHRRLFRRWLRFAGSLMPGGLLPRADSELVILRVAHNAGSDYEWRHHERLGRTAGLSAEEIERVRRGPGAPGWSPRHSLLLRATDELDTEGTISDQLWAELEPIMTERELIELCMLVGHYEMLAMTLSALRVEPDPVQAPPPRLARLVQRAVGRIR